MRRPSTEIVVKLQEHAAGLYRSARELYDVAEDERMLLGNCDNMLDMLACRRDADMRLVCGVQRAAAAVSYLARVGLGIERATSAQMVAADLALMSFGFLLEPHR
jgi:hypothetical protein